jgi:hypothetical protein
VPAAWKLCDSVRELYASIVPYWSEDGLNAERQSSDPECRPRKDGVDRRAEGLCRNRNIVDRNIRQVVVPQKLMTRTPA